MTQEPPSGAGTPSSSPKSPDEASGGGEVTLIGLLNILLERRRRIFVLSILGAVAIVLVTLVLPRTWTSSGTFLPQGDQVQSSRLSSLAAQFGVSVPLQGGGESPQFYADLMRSESLLEEVVETEYPLPADGDTARTNLIRVYDVEKDDHERAVAEAVDALREDLWVTTNAETGVVRFSVEMESPELARGVAQRLVDLVNEFNLESRQTRAAEEADFLEERVEEARQDLLAAEDSLKGFLERNRSYQGSPTLRFEYQRLQRRVGLEEQVYTSLSQSYEEARISRVRNTPVITVVEAPQRPAKPDRRRLLLKGVLGILLGFFVAVVWSIWEEYLRGTREQVPGDYRRFAAHWGDIRQEIGSAWRRVRRGFSGGES